MWLWSLHPKYLDSKGLVAVWREALLAQKVFQGRTKGYHNHLQLAHFCLSPDPAAAIAAYLAVIAEEAGERGYTFDRTKIVGSGQLAARQPITRGQILYEWEHLKAKLSRRDPDRYLATVRLKIPDVHPLFQVIEGDIEPWEKQG